MQSAPSISIPVAPDAPRAAEPRGGGLWLPAGSLCRRELVRFLRQRHRIIGALATPIVFWLLIGAGMGRSFQVAGLPGGDNYLQFFFPGTVVMILLFTAIFSTISIIEDRREGFLQSVLVAPVPRMAIVLGKVLGGTVLAFGQARRFFLLLGPLAGLRFTPLGILAALGVMLVLAFALTALGFCIAWRMSSTQGFHAIMNLFLMPMWFLSGALFPVREDTFAPLRWAMQANPLTYGLAAMRRALWAGQETAVATTGTAALPGWGVSIAVTVAFAAVMLLLATLVARGRTEADLAQGGRIRLMQTTDVHHPADAPLDPPVSAADAAPRAIHRGISIALWSLLGVTMLGVAVWTFLTRVREPDLPVLFDAARFTLVDQDNRPLSADDLQGRTWVCGFVFTNCAGICPIMTGKMAALQAELPADVHLVSFSVDPTNDTPAVLKAYAARFKADTARWHFLTGERAKVIGVVEQMKMPFKDAEGDSPIIHSEKLLLIDGDGKVRGIYESKEAEAMKRLTKDATALAKWTAKQGGRSGTR